MNRDKNIEQNLRAAPKPTPPDGLLQRLERDVALSSAKAQRSALRRWFAPAGGPLALGRIAAAALLAVVVLLPLSYAGTKIVQRYFTEGPQVTVTQNPDGSVTKTGTMTVSMGDPDSNAAAEPTAEERAEIEALKQAGAFEKTLAEEWTEKGMTFRLYQVSYTLSSGKVVTTNEIEAGTSTSASTP